jgi:hypothetical protein
MSVVLEPPLTRSGAWRNPDLPKPVPLVTGPRFVRGAGNSRWHRPRSGVDHGSHVSYRLWCGQTLFVQEGFVSANYLPKVAPLCGTCDGRAVGAGQDEWPGVDGPSLVFNPDRLTPPRRCPGSRRTWCVELSPTVGRCLVCGAFTSLRSSGGPYNPRWGMTNHEPGPGLVAGCPFHAWRELRLIDGRVMCGCKKEAADA